MLWIWLTGGLLLAAGLLLTYLLRPHHGADGLGFVRAKRNRQVIRRMRRLLRTKDPQRDAQALHQAALPLMEHLMHMNRDIASLPPLPAAPDGEPRIMDIARDAADQERFTRDALMSILTDWPEQPTPAEVAAFPVCIALAQSQRLASVFSAMQADARERSAAQHLARRLMRCKHPDAVLKMNTLNSTGLCTLLCALRESGSPALLSLLDAWLEEQGVPADSLAHSGTQRQVLLAEEIRRAQSCFAALDNLNWHLHCSEADPVHALLINDPGRVYPRMDAASQLQLRLEISELSRRVRLDPAEVIRRAFILCGDAEERSLEQYLGYYFQDAQGLMSLHRSLPTRRGWLYAHLSRRRDMLTYCLYWGVALAAGFGFLQGGQPVFMLPFFALVVGSLCRPVRMARPLPLPGMHLSPNDEALRTLVVLHAEMADPHEAIQAVRRLKTARHAFPRENVDFLLLGDFTPAVTAVSSGDLPIIQAASAAIAALEAENVMYLHRGRTWEAAAHRYCARGGMTGAVGEVCRLIAQGECRDVIACSTVEPAELERRYAYVLALPASVQPAHGLLERLLSVMAHPLCQRYPGAKGMRGHAMLLPEECAAFDGAALLRPDAYLEATGGLLPEHIPSEALCGELAGQTRVSGAHIAASDDPHSWDTVYARSLQAWRLAPWQLPLVSTPAGMVNNPLPFFARFRLREGLRKTLVPFAQCMLLLWSLLTSNWPLLLLALLAPEIGAPLRRREDFLALLCRLSLLPARAAANAAAIVQLLRRRSSDSPDWPALETWVQGLSATAAAALIFLLPASAVPAFGLTVLFACFPLAHRFLDAPVLPAESLQDEHIALLDSAASAAWRFFTELAEDPLPPCAVQFEPALGAETVTSPEAIGACLLSCVCAKDLGFVSVAEAARRIRRIIDQLDGLPMPLGLPCRRYALPSLTVQDAGVDAAAAGFLICTLMVTAQALRVWLPELPPEDADLSADISAIAAHFDIGRLYDPDATRFHAALDENGQGIGYADAFADATLLLSVAACAQGRIPPEHLRRLRRTRVALPTADVPLSRHGAASEHLLAGLFLPISGRDAMSFIRTMKARGQSGLFGQDACGTFAFASDLRCRRGIFGIPEAASEPVMNGPVYAPHAAALCLPFAPRLAADALLRFQSLGALGPNGFCDAIDLTRGIALVGLHDAFHQGIMLAAAAHVLADRPIQRYFCALPEVEACLPLLQPPQKPLTLPLLPRRAHQPLHSSSEDFTVAPMLLPPMAHLLGTADFRMLVDANGSCALWDGDMPLTRVTHGEPGGIQLYLADEGRIYRLGSTILPGTVTFAPGEARFEQVCGSIRAEVAITVDTVRRRAIHLVTLTNLSTRDRHIDLADLLLPDLGVPSLTLESARPGKRLLTLHARGTDRTLHHTVDASPHPLSIAACTDLTAFLGRGRSLHQPASLEEPMQELLPGGDCLSFRLKLALGGRGQVSVWFTTSLMAAAAPDLSELTGIRTLAALQHEAIRDQAALTAEQHRLALRLIPPAIALARRVALLMDEARPTALHDLIVIAGWFLLHGMPLECSIAAPSDDLARVRETLQSQLAEEHIRVVDISSFDTTGWLVLRSSEPLDIQVDRLYSSFSLPAPVKAPIPALLPEQALHHTGPYGGFDPDTSDFIIQLEPGQTTPAPWTNRHISRHYSETVDERGLDREQVLLRTEDGTLLSPFAVELPRSVRIAPGETHWEAWSDTLDIRLCAAALPGHRCGLRVLRLRNAADHPLTLTVTVLAQLDENSPLQCAPGTIIADTASRLQPFLAGYGWTARTTDSLRLEALTGLPAPDAPDLPDGHTALLTTTLTLQPNASGKVCWPRGLARHSEDIAAALATMKEQGTSELLRSVRASFAQRLCTITVTTPEDTFTLLINRILPAQAMCANGLDGVPALIFLSPQEARRKLLYAAMHPFNRDDWPRIALLTAAYIRITQDETPLDARLPQQDAPLYQACRDALLSLPIDEHGVPLGPNPARRCFLYAAAASALDALRPDEKLRELHRNLLNTAEIRLWQDGHYGESLHLDAQALSLLALGDAPRTRQAVGDCWAALYDQPHGLIRTHEATDAPTLPGLPENGGMITHDAVCCLHALMGTGHTEEAFELLRALNPLHHTDDALRQETYRGAPWLLHGGMCAAPQEAGRAVPDGGDEAAALLYAIVLHDVFGLRREGSVIRIEPHVPPEWDDFTITLQEGASTWRITAERRTERLTIDGEETDGNAFSLLDDGKIHRVRFPLR